MRLTTLTREVKELAQELALLRASLDEPTADERERTGDQGAGDRER